MLSHSPLRVEVFGTLAVRLICYLVPSLIFFFFDTLLPTASYSIKAQGHLGLPSGHKRRKPGRNEAMIIGWSLFNVSLSIAVQCAIEFGLTKLLRWRSLIKVAVRLPYPWGITIDIVRGFIVREVSPALSATRSLVSMQDSVLIDKITIDLELCHPSVYTSQP